MTRLRATGGVEEVELLHIYREFNGDADGICNEVLDLGPVAADTHEFVVNRGWQ